AGSLSSSPVWRSHCDDRTAGASELRRGRGACATVGCGGWVGAMIGGTGCGGGVPFAVELVGGVGTAFGYIALALAGGMPGSVGRAASLVTIVLSVGLLCGGSLGRGGTARDCGGSVGRLCAPDSSVRLNEYSPAPGGR